MGRMCRKCSRRLARRLLASLRRSIAANARLISALRNAQIDGFRRVLSAEMKLSHETMVSFQGRWA